MENFQPYKNYLKHMSNEVSDYLTTQHIPTNNPTYVERLEHLIELYKGKCYKGFSANPLNDPDPIKGSPEIFAIINRFIEDGISDNLIYNWYLWESRGNSIDWIVDQLLDSIDCIDRESLSEIPIRITDEYKLDIHISQQNDKIGILIDRSLVALIDYLFCLLHIEAFRPSKAEFLSDPPSENDVIQLFLKAGSFYNNGEWSTSIIPIDRKHFRKFINQNLTKAKIGALLFLIAHEYGHIKFNHQELYSNLESTSDSFGTLKNNLAEIFKVKAFYERQADEYSWKLAINAIKKFSKVEDERPHFEIGFILLPLVLNLMEGVILKKLEYDFDKFTEIYVKSHGTWYGRLRNLLKEHGTLLHNKTRLLFDEYLLVAENLAIEIKNFGLQSINTELDPNRRRWDELRIENGSINNISLKQDIERILGLMNAEKYEEALECIDNQAYMKEIQYFESIKKIDLFIQEYSNIYSRLCHLRGSILTYLKNDTEASEWYERTTSVDPNSEEPWADLAGCYYRLARYEDALNSSQKAITISEKDGRAWLTLFYSLQSLGQQEKALDILYKGLECTEHDPLLLKVVIKLLLENNSPDRAFPFIEELILKNPDDYMAWLRKGQCLFAMNKFEDSVSAYNRSIYLNPEGGESNVWKFLGFSLAVLNKPEAEDTLIKALDYEPGDIPATQVLSEYYIKNGASQKAIKYIEKALKIYPDSEILSELKNRITFSNE